MSDTLLAGEWDRARVTLMTIEMDMGYADAFRLWIMSAFDDDRLLRKMLQKTGIPDNWVEWVDEHGSR